jgi:predicted  nucleic acid-binding Zn-ribbon protein
MVHCERCGSRFHSARALMIENCPRCLLRDDVTTPLVVESADRAAAEEAAPGDASDDLDLRISTTTE